MQNISELRHLGNAAFFRGEWLKAVDAYSQAMKISEQKDVALYSHRSASYLKLGDSEHALQDAETCIQLKPDYPKGYVRKGAALYALQRYAEAEETYQTGLEQQAQHPFRRHRRHNKASATTMTTLEKGLRAAQRARSQMNRTQSARRRSLLASQCVQRHSMRRTASQDHNKSDKGILVDYIQQKQRHVELQMVALQAQLEFIHSLQSMTYPAQLQSLFNTVDVDGDGYVSAQELAANLTVPLLPILQSAPKGDEIHNDDDSPLGRAIRAVAVYDKNGDARLNLKEFEDYVHILISKELRGSVSFREFCQYVILHGVYGDDDEDYANEVPSRHRGSIVPLAGLKHNKKIETMTCAVLHSSPAGDDENDGSSIMEEDDIDEKVRQRGTLLDTLGNEKVAELFQLLLSDTSNRVDLLPEVELDRVMEIVNRLDENINPDSRYIAAPSTSQASIVSPTTSLEFSLLPIESVLSSNTARFPSMQRNPHQNNTLPSATSEMTSRRQELYQQSLNYEEFGKIVMGLVAWKGSSLDEMTTKLTTSLQKCSESQSFQTKGALDKYAFLGADQNEEEDSPIEEPVESDCVGEEEEEEEYYEEEYDEDYEEVLVSAEERLQGLFDLWNSKNEGQGVLSRELESSFRRFEQTANRSKAGKIFAGSFRAVDDTQEDVQNTPVSYLNVFEFQEAVTDYADLVQVDVHQLIDFLCLSAVFPSNRAVAYSAAMATAVVTNKPITVSLRGHDMRQGIRIPRQEEENFFFDDSLVGSCSTLSTHASDDEETSSGGLRPLLERSKASRFVIPKNYDL